MQKSIKLQHESFVSLPDKLLQTTDEPADGKDNVEQTMQE
jgi:hypothetical protein